MCTCITTAARPGSILTLPSDGKRFGILTMVSLVCTALPQKHNMAVLFFGYRDDFLLFVDARLHSEHGFSALFLVYPRQSHVSPGKVILRQSCCQNQSLVSLATICFGLLVLHTMSVTGRCHSNEEKTLDSVTQTRNP